MTTCIEQRRKELGYTQRHVANEIQVTEQSYRNIEKGRHQPLIVPALLLCKLFNLDPYNTFLNPPFYS